MHLGPSGSEPGICIFQMVNVFDPSDRIMASDSIIVYVWVVVKILVNLTKYRQN